MKYYLIIGYQLGEKYKDFPTIGVHLNDQLIDEFICDNEDSVEISTDHTYNDTYTGEPYDGLRSITNFTTETQKMMIPKKYRIMEIDTTAWSEEAKLVLEVSNNYSDYNNGFIKKRSMVFLDPVFFIRKDILDDEVTICRILEKYIEVGKKMGGNLPHYVGGMWNRNFRHKWPGINAYPRSGLLSPDDLDLLRGGNYKIELKIKKKYKMYMLQEDRWENKGYVGIDRYFIAWYQHHTKNNLSITTNALTDMTNAGTGLTINSTINSKVEINRSNED